jgi:trimeric autotransporter adhesin
LPELSGSDIITTIAGNGTRAYGGEGGLAIKTGLMSPFGVALDTSGNLYIADNGNNRVRLVTKSSGIVTTVAGDGTKTYGGDGGNAKLAQLIPIALAVDALGNMYIGDTGNHCVRLVTKSTGIITTVAGDGTYGYSGDGGLATLAKLSYPDGITIGALGVIYIADSSNHCIRIVNSAGIISTIAGDGTGIKGYFGDDGQATLAKLAVPHGVAIDASGNMYIADYGNNRIRLVKSSGIITTVAGDGTTDYIPGGPALATGLNGPYHVALDASGSIFVSGGSDSRIVMVTSTGIISTVAGDGTFGYFGDGGLATSSVLRYPRGIALDASGVLYIADEGNARIRVVGPRSSPTASPVLPPSSWYTRPPMSPPTKPSKKPVTAKPSKMPVKCKTKKPTGRQQRSV